MNVASKQLSQELYELSGWNCVRDWYFAYHKAAGEVEYDLKLNADESKAGRDDFPAYDVGYLLRKLPGYSHVSHIDEEHSRDGDTFYKASYQSHIRGQMIDGRGQESPEDAVAWLCIELFKQGILKPSKGGTDS